MGLASATSDHNPSQFDKFPIRNSRFVIPNSTNPQFAKFPIRNSQFDKFPIRQIPNSTDSQFHKFIINKYEVKYKAHKFKTKFKIYFKRYR